MCHATLAGRKAGSVSTNKSQFVHTLSTNKAYQFKISSILYLYTCFKSFSIDYVRQNTKIIEFKCLKPLLSSFVCLINKTNKLRLKLCAVGLILPYF